MSITVKVVQSPGELRTFELNDNANVQDAASLANINLEGMSIRVNGLEATNTTTLTDGSRVVVAAGLKGNR